MKTKTKSRRDDINFKSMANTYTQIHVQTIFAVKNRRGLVQNEWKDELYKYITGIIQRYKHKLLAINGMPDHLHIFFGMRPTQSLPDLMQDIKGNSSKWINDKNLPKVDLSGKKVSEHLPIVNRKYLRWFLMFRTRKFITDSKPFWMSM